jgi:hypothetical protein
LVVPYRFIYDTFVIKPGPRRCAGCFCTFTDGTKRAVGEKRFNQFASNGVLNVMMINSPGGPRKADDSDHPLKEVNIAVLCAHFIPLPSRGSMHGFRQTLQLVAIRRLQKPAIRQTPFS